MAQTRSVRLEGRVRWCGPTADAVLVAAAFDVYVLRSRTEGTPMVRFEVMAAGVPIMADRAGGVPDVLLGDTAALVPPEDPEALGRALEAAISAPEIVARSARLSHSRPERKFSVQPWVDCCTTVNCSVNTSTGAPP